MSKHLGPRHGVRWSAGLGCTGHGTVLRAAEQTWTSRRAAVAWIIENQPAVPQLLGGRETGG